MVKKITFILLYTIFFLMAFIYFMPKTNMYYFVEKQLQKEGIVIDGEKLKEHSFSLQIKNATIYMRSIEAAKITTVNINVFLVQNSISVENVLLSDMAANFLPLHVKHIELDYDLWNPLHVKGKATGEFGEADIDMDILKRHVKVFIKASKKMLSHYSTTLKHLKKNKNGGFVYEQSF